MYCCYVLSLETHYKGEMQVLPVLRSHKEYINFVQQNLNDDSIPKAHDDVPDKLILLDLTPIRLLALQIYKDSGRPAFAPEDMMRTFVAMTLCGITSPTDWVNDYLKDKSGFYAIISGFIPGDTPSVGCMYDFTNRLLNIPKYCKENHIRHKRKKLTRTQKNS
jgi:hypothetical protein